MEKRPFSSNVHELDPAQHPERSVVPADQLERIIARAAVLQNASGEGHERRLTPEEIVSIGEEVGLSPEHVRRALAEWRADSLAPPEPEDDPFAARLVGPAHVRVRRIIAGEAGAVHRRFERHLRETELMRPIRQRADESLWEASEGLATSLKRGLSWAFGEDGRSYELSELKSLGIVTAEAGEDSTMVTLTADLSEERDDTLSGWAWTLFGMAAVGLAFVIIAGSWWAWLLLLGAVGGAVAGPWMMTRGFRNSRRRAALLLEGLLDQLEPRRY